VSGAIRRIFADVMGRIHDNLPTLPPDLQDAGQRL
jgi:hypothetical protein